MSISPSEYHPYYKNYIDLSGVSPLLSNLEIGMKDFNDFVSKIPDDKMSFAYAEGKWSIGQLLMHLIDSERVFQHRAFRFARNDSTPLPGFEQDDYVPESNSHERSKESIISEFTAVRNSTIQLFKSFDDERLLRIGTASGSPMSVRALGHVICGHQVHHFGILKERYL